MAQKPMNQELLNIDPLILKSDMTKTMKEVTSLAIFQSSKNEFDPNGLFSVPIFGAIGHEDRLNIPAYIDLKIPILHPLVFRTILTLKSAYKDIVEGKVKVKFDNQLGDFVIDPDGQTGYSYFINNIERIKWNNFSESDQRDYRIQFVKKFANKENMFDKWLVIPAGYRDYTIDEKGQPSEDGINNLYRKLLATAQMLKNTRLIDNGSNVLDSVKLKIQKITVEIYEYIEKLLDGKGKFIQHRWASRNIAYGTRNVITSVPTPITDLDSPNKITANHTIVGITQYIKGLGPLAMNKVHVNFINRIMSANVDQAYLIDPKTMQTKLVNVPAKEREAWLSLEGLNSIFNKLLNDHVKMEPIVISGYYPCVIAEKGKDVYVIFDTANLPDGVTLKDLRPITYMEMVYISVLDIIDKYLAFITRYPITGLGSIYPSRLYVKTTTVGREMTVHLGSRVIKAPEYPKMGYRAFNSFNPHYTHLARLDADFDGDVMSLNILLTDESTAELDNMLKDKKYYLTPGGTLTYSAATDIPELVMKHMTAEPLDPKIKTDIRSVKID